MSELHFPNLTIKGFRGIRELTIPQLGRVNLITGKNNTGKSSVLEALQLFANNAAPWVINQTLALRGEEVTRREDNYFSDLDGMVHISTLFHGFPYGAQEFTPIEICSRGRHGVQELKIHLIRASFEASGDGKLQFASIFSPDFNESRK